LIQDLNTVWALAIPLVREYQGVVDLNWSPVQV
jgi:hypothetical protein